MPHKIEKAADAVTGKHTPGPWRISDDLGTKQIRAANNESLMGDEPYYPWVPENPEDWHLISAAPDLLEVLEEAADPISGYLHGPLLDRARAAIAKARGQE